MNDDAALLSRLGAALAVEATEPSDAALAALTDAVRAKRVERTQVLQQEARDERRRALRGNPVRRYAAVAAAVAVSPVAVCATTAVAGIEPPAPLRPIAELLGFEPTSASPDPATTDGPAYESQALGAVPTGAVADAGADQGRVPTAADGPTAPATTTPTTSGAPVIEPVHTTLPGVSGPGNAIPNVTPGTTVPPVGDPTTPPTTDPGTVPTPDPAPAPTPGNTPPPTTGSGPGAGRG